MDLAQKGLLLVLCTAIISGISIFFNGIGVKGFEPSVFTFSKNVVVAVLLFSTIIGVSGFSKLRELSGKDWFSLSLIGFLGGSIPFLLFFYGLKLTTGTTSAFIHKTLFIYASIFAFMFLKEKLHKGFVIGAVLLLMGNYFFIFPDFKLSTGHLLILLATVFWAAENTYSKHVLECLSGTIVAFGRMFFGSLFIFAFLLFSGKYSLVISMSAVQYGWIIFTALLLFLYVFSYYNGLKLVRVSTATSILTLSVPITTTMGWIFSGNLIQLSQIIGMLFLISGVFSIIFYPKIFENKVRVYEGC
jgi:drug/metabolite transporter (DMT)-like permease